MATDFYDEESDSFKSDWLYFIQQGQDGPIKIGRSRKPTDRLIGLQTGSHQRLRLIHAAENAGWQEAFWHECFRPHRKSGEWFRPDCLARAVELFKAGEDWLDCPPNKRAHGVFDPREWAEHLRDAFEAYEEGVFCMGMKQGDAAFAAINDPDFDGRSIGTRHAEAMSLLSHPGRG